MISLFDDLKVLKPEELAARREIEYEKYMMKRQIEASVAIDLAQNTIMPVAINYQNFLLEILWELKRHLASQEAKWLCHKETFL